MHPISKLNFDRVTGRLAVKFHNGTAVVTGYVSKQLGSKRFVVKAGPTERTCTLAQSSGELTTLTTEANLALNTYCTIEVTPHGGATENVKSISASRLTTVQGSSVTWKLGTASAATGQGTIATFTQSAPVMADPAPVATSSSVTDNPLGFVAATDANTDVLTYTITSIPTVGTTKVGATTVTTGALPYPVAVGSLASITYRAAVGGNGARLVVVTVTDGLLTDTATSTINVSAL